MGQLPFDRIKQLAQTGQLPKRLLTVKKPFCAACQYSKMTKRPWRVKGDNKHAAKTATQPGQVVSVDQLKSNSPGLIAQLKGKLTHQRYKYATIFVARRQCKPSTHLSDPPNNTESRSDTITQTTDVLPITRSFRTAKHKARACPTAE